MGPAPKTKAPKINKKRIINRTRLVKKVAHLRKIGIMAQNSQIRIYNNKNYN